MREEELVAAKRAAAKLRRHARRLALEKEEAREEAATASRVGSEQTERAQAMEERVAELEAAVEQACLLVVLTVTAIKAFSPHPPPRSQSQYHSHFH